MKTTVENVFQEYLEKSTFSPSLKEAMSYSFMAGGKRLRPQLLLETIKGFQQDVTLGSLEVATALEMIHTYSLIHDDLPAMDNDDLRRGKPTNHKVFGEALAILAGDGLLTGAFELVGKSQNSPEEVVALVRLLGKKAGNNGMVSGQVLDLEGEKKHLPLEELKQVHALKTGALIEFALMAGGILSQQEEETLQILEKLGHHFGLAFQIKDDLLDVEGTAEELGKNPHQDQLLNKSTYPSLLGLMGAKKALEKEIKAAEKLLAELKKIGFNGEIIQEKLEKLQEK